MMQKHVAVAIAAAIAALQGMAFGFEWEAWDGGEYGPYAVFLVDGKIIEVQW